MDHFQALVESAPDVVDKKRINFNRYNAFGTLEKSFRKSAAAGADFDHQLLGVRADRCGNPFENAAFD